MIIKSIELTNFKSHEHSVIKFGNITSITGTNYSGKTNILRALKLVLYNEDWPKSWIRYGATSSSIKINLVDGKYVKRSLSSKTSGSEIEIFDGVNVTKYAGKKDASEAISKVTGIRKVVLDEGSGAEDLNFLSTKEVAPLLGGRADTVQRKVCGILGLNDIEDAKVRLVKKERAINTELETASKKEIQLRQGVTAIIGNYECSYKAFETFKNTYTQWYNVEQVLQKTNQVVNLSHITNYNVAPIKESVLKMKSLKIVIDELVIQNQLACLRKVLTSYQGMLQSLKEVDQLTTVIETTKNKLDIYNNTENELGIMAAQLYELKSELKRELEELGICPLCQSKIQNE